MTEPIIVPATRIVIKPLLFGFIVLAGYFFAWGAVFCVDALTRWIFGTVTGPIGWVPYVGKVVNRPILSLEHKLTSFLGGLEAHFDRQMAARWHALASLVRMYAESARMAAIYDWHVAVKVATFWGNAATGQLFKGAHDHAKAAQGTAAVSLREAIDARQRAQANESSGAGATVVPHPHIGAPSRTYPLGGIPARVAGLEGELGQVIEYDIPSLNARTRAITDGLGRVWKWVRAHPLAIPQTVAIAAVAHALGKLGGSWIRCNNWNRIGRSVCRLPLGLIDELFAGAIVTFAVLDICDFAAAAQSIAQEFVPELIALVDVENALIGCHGATAAPMLGLPPLHLPPTNLGLPLAA